jgi:hypothetical protein
MVLEANKQIHEINKHIVAFINSCSIDAEIKTVVLTNWKEKSNMSKLKHILQNSNDKKKPKRVMNKYLHFCAEERPKIFAENPGMDIKKVTVELGRRWNEFQKTQRNSERDVRLQQLFEKDQKRYDDEKKEYPEIVKQKKPAPKSSYLKYCSVRRLEIPKISMKELAYGWAMVKRDPVELEKYKI